jgi:hypothetical protein
VPPVALCLRLHWQFGCQLTQTVASLPGRDRRTGVVVISLRRDNHIQFFSGVIQPLNCRQQLIDDLCLAPERRKML